VISNDVKQAGACSSVTTGLEAQGVHFSQFLKTGLQTDGTGLI
jgi:hypothetical protein